jgi:hypothetical protein
MIVLMSVSFALSLSSQFVVAEDTGCCIKDDLGNYCSDDATLDQCEGSFYSGVSCDQLTRQDPNIPHACERVTCLEEDGSCSAQKYYKQCVDNGGGWDVNPLSQVSQCSEACCQIIDGADIIRQYRVNFAYQCYQDAEVLGLTGNAILGECEVLQEQLGCCVSNFGCSMASQFECSGVSWTPQLCSATDLCGDCGDYDKRECYQGDVYLVNDCGEFDPAGPTDDCDLNTEICNPGLGDASCTDISCSIPIEYTTLSYDTSYLLEGEVGVEYKNLEGAVIIEKIKPSVEEYSIEIPNGGSACVQYQGPGETHMVYTCNLGEADSSTISAFKGREYICEYNSNTDSVEVRENRYSNCLSCDSEHISDGPAAAVVDFFTWVAEAGGWAALQPNFWDYWVVNPGLCDTEYSCLHAPANSDEKQDCVYDPDSNWCVPKYPIDASDICSQLTDSKAGSPWFGGSDNDNNRVACQSCGSCKLKSETPISPLGTAAVCLGDVVVGGAIEWALQYAADGALAVIQDLDEPTPAAVSGEDVPPADTDDIDVGSEDGSQGGQAADATSKSRFTSAMGWIKGIPQSFLNNYLLPIIGPILRLGGIINLDYLDDALKKYFFGIDYEEEQQQNQQEAGEQLDGAGDDTPSDDGQAGSGPVDVTSQFDNTGNSPGTKLYDINGDGMPDLAENGGLYWQTNSQGTAHGGAITEYDGQPIADIFSGEAGSGGGSDSGGPGNDGPTGDPHFEYGNANIPTSADSNGDSQLTGQEIINYYVLGNNNNFDQGQTAAMAEGVDLNHIINNNLVDEVIVNTYSFPYSFPLSPPTGAVVYVGNLLFKDLKIQPLFSNPLSDGYDYQYYGQYFIEPYSGAQVNEFEIAKEYLDQWWREGAVIKDMFWDRLKSASTNILVALLLRSLGDDFLDAIELLSPQHWIRKFVCQWGIGWFSPTLAGKCENKYFIGMLTCGVISGINQAGYNARVCTAGLYTEIGYNNCNMCNDDELRPCTPSRCYGLGTDCGYDILTSTCDVREDVLQRCGETINEQLVISTDLAGAMEVNYSDTYYGLEFETSKSATCKYSDVFQAGMTFDDFEGEFESDRAGLNHEGEVWASDPLITDYKYFVQCKWSCSEEDWGVQYSPAYEINLHKLPKGDLEPPIIIESYPYPNQLLEPTNSVVMWVKADEPLVDCKYSGVDFTEFQDEVNSVIEGSIASGVGEGEADAIINDLFMGFDLMNPDLEMTRKATNEFEVSLTLEHGTDHVYSIVCTDPSGHSSRPKIMLFRVSNPFGVSITSPENGLSTSEHLEEVSVSTGAVESTCRYSFGAKERYERMNSFVETGGRAHNTQLPEPLRSGEYNLYVSCVNYDTLDLNTGTSNFLIYPDLTAPRLVKLTSAGSNLKIGLDEASNCTYSEESFTAEQIPMVATGSGENGYYKLFSLTMSGSNKYYINCKDRDENLGSYIVYP